MAETTLFFTKKSEILTKTNILQSFASNTFNVCFVEPYGQSKSLGFFSAAFGGLPPSYPRPPPPRIFFGRLRRPPSLLVKHEISNSLPAGSFGSGFLPSFLPSLPPKLVKLVEGPRHKLIPTQIPEIRQNISGRN